MPKWVKRHWIALLGGIAYLPSIWRGFIWLIDWEGRIELIAKHWHDVGELGVVLAFLLNPPPWTIFPFILIGAILFALDWHRHKRKKQTISNADKVIPVSIKVNSSTGSIVAPSGGINTITNMFRPEPRDLNSEWGIKTKDKILQTLNELPRNKIIAVTSLIGDEESASLSRQIHEFIRTNGFNVEGDGPRFSVFAGKISGIRVENHPNEILFIIGTNPD